MYKPSWTPPCGTPCNEKCNQKKCESTACKYKGVPKIELHTCNDCGKCAETNSLRVLNT
jgi:hypothetical protein